MVGAKGRSGGDRTPLTLNATNSQPPMKPNDLSPAASNYWDRLCGELKGYLKAIDGHELKILATLLAQSDHLSETIRNDPDDAKATRLYLQVSQQIHRMSASFGLNPADRQRLKVDAEPEADPFADYLRQLQENRS